MSAPTPDLVCSSCGASYTPPASVCWLCKKGLEPPAIVSAAAAPSPNSSITFSIAGILLATTLCAVFFSVLMMAPGLAILLAILSVPALVRTGLAAQHRSQLGKPIPPMRKLLWFLSSLTVTTILVVVVVVASVGTFCAVCLGAGTEKAIPVALLVAGAVTVGVLVAGSYWIRFRWRRDVDA